MNPSASKHKFTLYVDEAGDDGLKAHLNEDKDLSSEWFVLGGIVSKTSDEPDLLRILNDGASKAGLPFGRDIHFARLNHKKKAIICHELALGPFRWFCVISHKKNMRAHRNSRAESISKKQKFLYNWMLRLLLERVTRYCREYNDVCSIKSNVNDLKVILSDRGGLRKPDFGDYFTRLWMQYHNGTTHLQKGLVDFSVFDPPNIFISPNSEKYGLQSADFIVSAVYKALPQKRQQTPKYEYIETLMPRCAPLDGKLFGAGIVIFPPDWEKSLSGEQLKAIKYFEGRVASPRLCVPTSELDRLPS